MHREKFTEKINRIVETIEAGRTPVAVQELYVFGSYSRGAIEPGDLDLIVVHEQASREYMKRIERHFKNRGFPVWDSRANYSGKFEAEMRRSLQKPGERIQILLAKSLSEVTGTGSKIKPTDPILIWSKTDRDWRNKLAAITPDEFAHRADRNHIVKLSRLRTTVGAMEAVVEMVELKRLILTRIPIQSISCELDADHLHWFDHWTKCKIMGKDSMKVFPYAMWWLQQNGQRCELPNRTEVWSKSRTHRAEIGKASLRWMLGLFESNKKLKRQCLIPHFKAKEPNDLLIFERGPNWQINIADDRI